MISDKRHDYPRHRWNALVAGPEWQRHFRLSEDAFDPERDGASARATAAALTALSRISADHRAVAATAIETLEGWFAAIEQNATGGKLREAAHLLEATLDEAAGGIDSRVSGRPLCPMTRATPQARIAHNVFLKYYAQGLQPYLAATLRSYERWHRAMRALLDQAGDGVDEAPAPDWLQRAAPAALRRSVTQHTQAWQDLLSQCDLMPARAMPPGAPSGP